jgi:hypothetical protein
VLDELMKNRQRRSANRRAGALKQRSMIDKVITFSVACFYVNKREKSDEIDIASRDDVNSKALMRLIKQHGKTLSR